MIFLFFFSSRRRHTRYWRDWSSDVCSSDLDALVEARGAHLRRRHRRTADALDARPHAAERPAHRVSVDAAEEAAPEAAQGHRHDGHGRPLQDALDAGTERSDGAVGREPSLGEDAYEAAVV